jgi:hypothetical protein
MSGMSDYLEVQLRKHLFRTGSFTKPTVLGVSLHTTDPLDDASGTEVSGGAYARVNLPPLDANWSAPDAVGGVAANLAAITFPAPVGANWGTVTHFGIWDAASGGNLLVSGALAAPKTINDGDAAPSFAIGALVITFA